MKIFLRRTKKKAGGVRAQRSSSSGFDWGEQRVKKANGGGQEE